MEVRAPVGNRVEERVGDELVTAVFDEADLLTSRSGGEVDVAYEHDAEGFLIADDRGTYRYDGAGRLVEAVLADGRVVSYGYDGDGVRRRRSVDGVTTVLHWDINAALPVLVGFDDADGTSGRFTYGPGLTPVAGRFVVPVAGSGTDGEQLGDPPEELEAQPEGDVSVEEPSVRTQNNGNGNGGGNGGSPPGRPQPPEPDPDPEPDPPEPDPGFEVFDVAFHADELGSVRAITGAGGEVLARYDYGPWGEVLAEEGPLAGLNPLRYTAALWDPAVGRYHLRARDYDPLTGRFTQPDPLGRSTGDPWISPYLYADGSPLALVDPSGLRPPCGVFGWVPAQLFGGCDLTLRNTAAELAGAVVGVGVGVKCTALTAGFGLVPCTGLGAAAGGGVHDLLDGDTATNPLDPRRRGVDSLIGMGTLGLGKALSSVFRRPTPAPNTAGSIRRVNPLGGTQNCVNCAIATDATLAGRPASALTSSGPQPISILERTFGGSFKPVSGADEIQQLLMDAGPGSRGIVFGSRGADPGHVFNAVNQRGVIRFLDGQSGGPASFEGFDAFHFLRTDL